MFKLLAKDTSNAKLAKTHDVHGRDWDTYILYMAPAEVAVSGVNLCPASTKGCRRDCLFWQGRARMFKNVNEARIRKTRLFIQEPLEFMAQLHADIRKALRAADKKGKRLAIRLNGTTDVDWSSVAASYPDVQFYDYTKTTRGMLFARDLLPSNYHVTFSRSETNHVMAARVLAAGGNVAVVVDSKVSVDWSDTRLIDEDKHDARFLDGKASTGLLVVLRAKGSLKGTGSQRGFCLNQDGWDTFLTLASKRSSQNLAA